MLWLPSRTRTGARRERVRARARRQTHRHQHVARACCTKRAQTRMAKSSLGGVGQVTLVGAGADETTFKVLLGNGETKYRPTTKLRALTDAEKNSASEDDAKNDKPEYPITPGMCRWEYGGTELPWLDEHMDKEEEFGRRSSRSRS
eukprot:3837366-Pleurochrysis_carterae.AAC.4